MHKIQENPILRHSLLATLCLGGSYLIGRKSKHLSSLALNTGAVLAVSIGTQDQRIPVRIFFLMATTLATTYATKASFAEKYFTPLEVSHAFAHSATIGGIHALTHHFFPSRPQESVAALKATGIPDKVFGKTLHDLATRLYNQDGMEEKAEAILKQAIQVYQEAGISGKPLARVLFFLTQVLLYLDKDEDANRILEQAIAVEGLPEDFVEDSLFNLAKDLCVLGKEESLKTCQDTDISKELLAEVLFDLGKDLYEDDEDEKAETILKQAIETYQNAGISGKPLAKVLFFLGKVLDYQGKESEETLKLAIQTYLDAAISGKPLAKVLFFLAEVLFCKNKNEEGEKILKEAITISLNEKDSFLENSLFDLGKALYNQDKKEFFNETCQDAGISKKVLAEVLYNIGEALYGEENWEAAKRVLTDAIKVGFDDLDLLEKLTELLDAIKAQLQGA